MNMKKCPYCGAAIPEGAHFCPLCTKSLIQKETPKPAAVQKKPKLWIIIAALLIVAVIIGVVFSQKPKTLDDDETAELFYETSGRTYRLILRSAVREDLHWKDAQPLYERKVPPGQQLAIPLQLYVFDTETGDLVSEEFYELISDSFVTVKESAGTDIPEPSSPSVNPGFPKAMLETDVVCTSQCSSGTLTWTIHMKNKDTLLLHAMYQIIELPQASYSYENTPLSTIAEIQALLDSYPEGDETQITLILAPIEYDGDLSFGNLTVALQGTREENASTTFTGSITITDSNHATIYIRDIDFFGNGEGSAIIGYGTFFVEFCTFTNFDVAIDGRDGSWPIPGDSTFENCRVAFRMDSSSFRARSTYFANLTFLNNETAVQLIRVPADDILYFADCVFEGNGTDFDVQSGNKIEME